MIFWFSLSCAALSTCLFAGYRHQWKQRRQAQNRWQPPTHQLPTATASLPMVPAYVVANVAACLRAGMSVPAAWEAALADAGVGGGKDVLELPEFSSVAPSVKAALEVSESVGIGLADSLDAIVGTLEEAEETARLLEIAQAGPQATARLLGILPGLGMFAAYLLGADPLQFFFSSGAGLAVLLGGLGFWLAGRLWVRHLVGRLAGAQHLGVDPVVAVRLLVACLQAGLAVPRSLQTVGRTCASPGLEVVARFFMLGAPAVEVQEFLRAETCVLTQQLGLALLPAWARGADPLAGLELVAQRLRKTRQQQVQVATQRLAVWLALPLGLCFLPAFVLLGVLPVAWGFFAA